MSRIAISTDKAPAAIGAYSQGIKTGEIIFLSGQIGLNPATMELQTDTFESEIRQVFRNLESVCHACGSSLSSVVKTIVFLTDLGLFDEVTASSRKNSRRLSLPAQWLESTNCPGEHAWKSRLYCQFQGRPTERRIDYVAERYWPIGRQQAAKSRDSKPARLALASSDSIPRPYPNNPPG